MSMKAMSIRFEEQHGKIEEDINPSANVKPPRKS